MKTRLALVMVMVAPGCGRDGFSVVRDELATCWPGCGEQTPTLHPFPFSFDDDQFFAQVSPSENVSVGCESLADLSITQSGSSSAVVNACDTGTSTLTRVRAGGDAVSDGYRCRGGGTMNIDGSWLEAADGYAIQCYDPGNQPTATLSLSGTTLYARPGTQAALFIADSYAADLELTNVLIRGGMFGLRFHTDGRPGTIALDTVCFYGESEATSSFGAAPFLFDPDPPAITAWNDVRWCTLEGGALVRHGAIERPY